MPQAKETYFKPIWPTLKLATSVRRFASPPVGELDNVMEFGSTVFGRCDSSYRFGSVSQVQPRSAADGELEAHLHAHVLERRVRFYRQANHAIRSTQTQQHGCDRSVGVDARGMRLMVVVVVVMVGRISSFGGGNSGLNLSKFRQF